MPSVRLLLRSAMLVVGSAALFGVAAHLFATWVIDDERQKQMSDLVEIILRRVEATIDVATETLGEIEPRGPLSCDSTLLQELRLKVYQRSSIKDIRSVDKDGGVLCSAFSETLEFDAGWITRDDMLQTRDSALRIFKIPQIDGAALGVLRDSGDGTSIVAVLTFNSYVFDILPPSLQGRGDVRLVLADGQVVGQLQPQSDSGHARSRQTLRQRSAAYPLAVEMGIDSAAFATWGRGLYAPIVIGSLGLGVLFGLLLARALNVSGPLGEIDEALRSGRFQPYYQPTFDLRTGAIGGCEMLARWVRRNGEIVSPGYFIPLAEATGRIETITWQLLAKALAEMQPLLKADKTFKLSVNVTPHLVLSPSFADRLSQLVSNARVSRRQIVLELTEREPFPDLAAAAKVVAQLQQLGFRVAMDDIGMGHSGLSQLKALGADIIKIDKFFIDTITLDDNTKAIVQTLVQMAGRLGMDVLAEGVETEEQRQALLACGVDTGQGYLLAPALPLDGLKALLERAGGSPPLALVA